MITDAGGDIIRVNQAFQDIGYGSAEVLGRHLRMRNSEGRTRFLIVRWGDDGSTPAHGLARFGISEKMARFTRSG